MSWRLGHGRASRSGAEGARESRKSLPERSGRELPRSLVPGIIVNPCSPNTEKAGRAGGYLPENGGWSRWTVFGCLPFRRVPRARLPSAAFFRRVRVAL